MRDMSLYNVIYIHNFETHYSICFIPNGKHSLCNSKVIDKDNDNNNNLLIILTGIHSKYTVFDMLHSRFYPASQDLSVSLNTIQ